LDEAITGHVLTSMRCDTGRIDPTLPEALAERLADRARAETELTAARNTAAILLREWGEASQAVGDITAGIDKLALQVVGAAVADRLANEVREFQAEIERRRFALSGWDRYATSAKLGLSHEVALALNGAPYPRPDLSVWQAAIDVLKLDAEAQVEVELPELRVPPLPSLSIGSTYVEHPLMTVAGDDGDPHHIVEPAP
jgi:hypothetical protein